MNENNRILLAALYLQRVFENEIYSITNVKQDAPILDNKISQIRLIRAAFSNIQFPDATEDDKEWFKKLASLLSTKHIIDAWTSLDRKRELACPIVNDSEKEEDRVKQLKSICISLVSGAAALNILPRHCRRCGNYLSHMEDHTWHAHTKFCAKCQQENEIGCKQITALRDILDWALSRDGSEESMMNALEEIATIAANTLEVCPKCGNSWAIHDADGACEPRE